MAPTSASTRRPGNTALIAVLAALSAAGLWFMRISTALNDVPVGFADIIATSTMPNGTRIKKHYTGLGPLDEMLSFLVAAFLPGPTAWNGSFYWQQLHFLLQITAILAIMNVEACRQRNQGSWLKYTAVFAILYQNLGGAFIIPIWWILFHRHSAEKSYFARGRQVPLPYARLILPSTILLYTVPTLAIFFPGHSLSTLQSLLAFWQLTPVYVNVPLWFAAPFASSSAPATTRKNADIPYLRALYAVTFVLSVAAHWYTVYGISTSQDPSVSYASVFVPSTYTWKKSLDWGLLWIFQWDWIICGLVHVIPAFVAVYDVQRIVHGKATLEQLLEGFIAAVALTWLAGPGAALSAVWYWREGKLALIEEAVGGKKKL